MRTLLLGTDFMYKQNGDLVPIEINTNVYWDNKDKIEMDAEVFDLSALVTFIENGEFTKIEYIGNLEPFFETLSGSVSVPCEIHKTAANSITVPYIEDNAETLIIRSAFDTTALVDDTYCVNKINFLNLIKTSSFGHEFAYKDSDGNLVNTITTILDNGDQPNFILKASNPHYDKDVYPKLFKVTTQSELEVILNNVDSDYFLMPFYYNNDKLISNHIPVVRSLNLLFPPNLESIQLGEYHKICENSINTNPTYNPTTFELDNSQRDGYLTTTKHEYLPKLLDTDLVELADGTFKTALDLQIGDELKTIDIPNPFDINVLEEVNSYKIGFTELQSGATYSTNKVLNKKRVSSYTGIGTITFTDSSTWEDTISSSYLVEKNGEIQFLRLQQIEAGDKVILIDTASDSLSLVEKIVQSVSVNRGFFEGWYITVERTHLFLTKASNDSTTSYVSIEHNGAPCNKYISLNCAYCTMSCSNCVKFNACYGTNWGGWGTCGALC